MNKYIVVYLYNGILLGNKNEQSTDTCYNMDGYQMHYINWISQNEALILNYSIYITFWQRQTTGTENKFVIVRGKGLTKKG